MLEQGYAYKLKMKKVCGLPYKRKGLFGNKIRTTACFSGKTHYLCSNETAISEIAVS